MRVASFFSFLFQNTALTESAEEAERDSKEAKALNQTLHINLYDTQAEKSELLKEKKSLEEEVRTSRFPPFRTSSPSSPCN